ncbi:hypothetical protein EB796_016139 [Bugula neritina]|uniref:Uncharacterized protein n=1 Tax=Bugula neritina TaxID=10212 RepID=A0A7J7JJJ4_BUGNE|nr:hypothetical protein EB796_016139 [Bugula neritina]
MKWAVFALLLLVAIVSSKELLGADDVDKKAAQSSSTDLTSKTLPELKHEAKATRKNLKDGQAKARRLKQEIRSKDTTKTKKRTLKSEFRTLRSTLHSTKALLRKLKKEIRARKMVK